MTNSSTLSSDPALAKVTASEEWLDNLWENLSDSERDQLLMFRGGCTCFLSPPCRACTEPMTFEEAEILGHVPPMGAEAETELSKPPVADIMSITRKMFR